MNGDLQVESLARDSLIDFLRTLTALPIAGSQSTDVKVLPAVTVRVTSLGEHPRNSGIHRLQCVLTLEDMAADTSEAIFDSCWGPIHAAVFDKNLTALLTTSRFKMYGVSRRGTVSSSTSSGKFTRSVTFEMFGTEVV